MKKYLTKNNLLYLLVFIIFLSTVLVVASFHEYWIDEAQGWLLARDASTFDLITKYLRYEGHPILWYILTKVFMLIGGDYNHYNLLSIFFTSLGVLLILFKTKFPWYIKVLLPFTFFIYYQYSIISRSYCLVFLLLILLSVIWEKKEEHYYLFTLVLVLLISTETHTYLIAGSIFLLELYRFWKEKDYKNKKKLICFAILFLSFLLTMIYLFPTSNVYKPINGEIFRLSKVFFIPQAVPETISLIFDFFLIIILLLGLIKEGKEKLISVLIITIPLILFMVIIYFSQWHYGILFVVFLLIVEIYNMHKNKYIKGVLIITCIAQALFGINSAFSEIQYSYAPSKEMAKLIRQYDYKNLRLFGHKFFAVIVNPYFDENIYDNWTLNKGFFSFDLRNNTYYEQGGINNEYDMVVYKERKRYKYRLNESKYNKYVFYGNNIFQTVFKKNEKYVIYVKKNLNFKKSRNDKGNIKVCY